jgi:hypothetical protein
MTPQSDVKIERSNGNGKGGKIFYYIRPLQECMNKSRKASGFTPAELHEKISNVITKWYSPMVIMYMVNGWVIGSNSKENALKEYWRVCERGDVGKEFEVTLK